MENHHHHFDQVALLRFDAYVFHIHLWGGETWKQKIPGLLHKVDIGKFSDHNAGINFRSIVPILCCRKQESGDINGTLKTCIQEFLLWLPVHWCSLQSFSMSFFLVSNHVVAHVAVFPSSKGPAWTLRPLRSSILNKCNIIYILNSKWT